jgi:hypothetical protein
MSKIDDLISPKKEVTFRGEKFMLEAGFTIEESPMINKAFGQKDLNIALEGMKEILKLIAKRIFPDATEKQISKIDAKYTQDLLEVFYQLDETEDSEKAEIKKVLENQGK